MTTQTISVDSLLVLTSIITDGTLVCVNSVEHNGYDDSDFCDIILDLANRDIREVCTHTTRGAGYTSSNSVAIATYSDEVRKALMAEFMTIGKEMALKYFQEHSVIHVGDTVQVSNPRARKFKGEIFTVDNISTYHDNYGRAQTTYAHGGDIKTSVRNCSVLAVSDSVLTNSADNLYYGMKF